MKKIIIISIILLLFLGHTPYYDLNELAVVDTIGISFNDNKYNLYLNIVNEDNKTYKITGDSLGEVFLKGETINNKRTYYKHLSVIIFDTNVLNDNKLFTFLKDEFTTIDYLTLSTNNLDNLFTKYHKSNDYKSFITKERDLEGTIVNITFKDLLSTSLDNNKSSSLPLIDISNDKLISNGSYIIDKNYILNKDLTKAYYLLNNKVTSYNEKIKIDDNYLEASLYDLKTTIKYNNNKLEIKVTGKVDSPDTLNLTKVKNKVKKKLLTDIKNIINLEIKDDIKITNISNTIYLKERDNLNNSYKNSKKDIIIDLKTERRNNYD